MQYGLILDPIRIGIEFLRVFETTNTVFNEDEIIFHIFENKNKYENNKTNYRLIFLSLFDNIQINNIKSTTGNSTAMSIYPRSTVKFERETNLILNIITGSHFQDENYGFNELLHSYDGSQHPAQELLLSLKTIQNLLKLVLFVILTLHKDNYLEKLWNFITHYMIIQIMVTY